MVEGAPLSSGIRSGAPRNQTDAGRKILVPLAALAAVATLVGGFHSDPQSARPTTSPALMTRAFGTLRSHLTSASVQAPSAPKTLAEGVAAPQNHAQSPVRRAPVSSPVSRRPSIATFVAEVKAKGIEPGSNWSWSMGDTSTRCGLIHGTGTGCTSAAGGDVHTVFGGSPTLALVAHELANAEALNDAVPNLMSKVSAAESGTSWSTTDALASCLVAHFMGFQDFSAGSWRCPDALASYVARNIHDAAPVTTQVTSICGKTSGAISTLTYTARSGVLTVKGPGIGSASETVPAGRPLTVSGVGTFIGSDQGGVVTAAGICTP
jgi:hypothetical protein